MKAFWVPWDAFKTGNIFCLALKLRIMAIFACNQKYRKVLSKLQQTFADHTAKFGKRYRNPFADDTTIFCEQYFVGF